GSDDGLVRLWDADTGQELKRFAGHNDWVVAVALAPDGRRAVSGGFDHTARVWDLEAGKEVCRFRGHPGAVRDVAFLPDGRRALSVNEYPWRGGQPTATADYSLRLWDTE